MNPITGEEYKVATSKKPIPDIYNDKTNLSNKSRRLVRILKQFDQRFPDNGFRSRSRLQQNTSEKVLQPKPIRDVGRSTIENTMSSRHAVLPRHGHDSIHDNVIFNSKEYEKSQLPSLSKRIQGRSDHDNFRAYEDNPVGNK